MIKSLKILILLSLFFIFSLNLKADVYAAIDCYDDNKFSCAFDGLQKAFNDGVYLDGFVPYILADLYQKGNGVKKDVVKGANFYSIAYSLTDNGYIKFASSTNLAWSYATTIGLRDKEKAAYWANISLNDAEDITFNNYGVFLEEGYIFNRDLFKAYEYYKKATEISSENYYYAFSNLGRFYMLGKGPLRPDKQKSLFYFKKAVDIGGKDATSAISYLRVLDRYNRLPTGISELSYWLEEDIIKYQQSNFLVLGWLHDDQNIVEGLKWFLLQNKLGENLKDRERSLELIDRGKELINYDEELFSQINLIVDNWIYKNWHSASLDIPDDINKKEKELEVPEKISSGSGFYINDQGYIITNHHVIDGCNKIEIHQDKKNFLANYINSNKDIDLGILKTDNKTENFLSFSNHEIRLGQKIVASGFPLQFTDKAILNVTFGNVSALVGLLDNINQLQFTAPIQYGNSGGPLLGKKGSLAGVVVSKLNDEAMLEFTGSIPQNVNFAVRKSILKNFLLENNIAINISERLEELSDEKIAEIAKNSTVKIVCKK
jgi:TPR repeat protein